MSDRRSITFRLPAALKARLETLAAAHQRSLSGEIVWALEQYVESISSTSKTVHEPMETTLIAGVPGNRIMAIGDLVTMEHLSRGGMENNR